MISVYYNAKEFPCGKALDLLYDAGYYELVDNSGNIYYKLTGSDENAIAETFRQFAVIGSINRLLQTAVMRTETALQHFNGVSRQLGLCGCALCQWKIKCSKRA